MTQKQSKIKIAVVQMNSGEDVRRNLDFLLKNIEQMRAQGEMPRLICTPENSLYMRTMEGAKFNFLKPDAPEILELAKQCKALNTNLHLGSLPLALDSGNYNSSLLIRDDGSLEPTYQKMHLFDIQLTNQKPVRESDAFKHGAQPSAFTVDGWKFGQTVCYDLRFSELYQHYNRHEQVDVLLIPAAFLVATGRAHWEILLRARAIENQAYVIAAAQSGLHQNSAGTGRRTFGHSMVIDPWGYVLYDSPSDLGFGVIELSAGRIKEVRTQIPMADHRRRDFFK